MTSFSKIKFEDSSDSDQDWGVDEVLEFQLSDQKKGYIIDGTIDQEVSKVLFKHCVSLPFQFLDSDREDTSHIQHLVHNLDLQKIEKNGAFDSLIHLAFDIMDNLGIEHPKKVNRAYINFNLHGDFQYPHDDGDEWTALFFIADEWNEDWMGEFFIHDPKYGIRLAVTPKPGRMVIFDGNIVHRGGVPSKLCYKPRITLAIKLSK